METRDMVYIALFAAFMAALGVFPPITLPLFAVPITAQSLGPMLAGAILGAKRATLSVILFCLLVGIGLPLLSGGRGGISPFIGPYAGFIYGWILCAFIVGLGYQLATAKIHLAVEVLILLVGGMAVIYLCGIVWLVWTAGLTLKAASLGMLVFIPGDLLKLSIVIFVRRAIKRAYPSLLPA